MLGGIAGSVLGGGGSLGPMSPSVQGGFIGNAGGLAAKYPLGLAGEIGDINEDITKQLKLGTSMGLAGSVAANAFGGGTQMGNAGGLGLGAAGIAGNFIDPMTIKKVF